MQAFFEAAFSSPLGAMVVIITLGVLFVNGWTDAPNAIASAIATRALTMGQGVLMAGILNGLGGLAALTLGDKVAETVLNLGDFSADAGAAALAAAMLAVILWAVAAWWFGIPTSESHGLMAALMGAALALSAGGISLPALGRVACGLIFSVGLGYLGGMGFSALFARMGARPAFWRGGQVAAAALMAFAHGLQDTPKFASILLLGKSLWGAGASEELPLWMLLLCSAVMSAGTLLGGGRIIRKVGEEMVVMDQRQGFAADLAGTVSLVLSTMQGLPVSTTHAKTCAMMGAAGQVDRKIAGSMFLAWGLTFPICGGLAFLLAKLFLLFPF